MAKRNIPGSIKKSFKSTKNVAKQAVKQADNVIDNATKQVAKQADNVVDNAVKKGVQETTQQSIDDLTKKALEQERLVNEAVRYEANMKTMPSITPLNETGSMTTLPHNNGKFVNDNGLGMPAVSPVMESQLRNRDIPFDGRQQYQPKAIDSRIRQAQKSALPKYDPTVSKPLPNSSLNNSVFTGSQKQTTKQDNNGFIQKIDEMMHSRPGKIAAGVGVSAFLVSNMNNSKGQMSNAQLYGQQTPYQ